MSTVLEGPERDRVIHDRDAFNLAVWEKLAADSELGRTSYRIETDEHGQAIMSPPPAPSHGSKQSRIARILGNCMKSGEVVTECPISTPKGVKAADVAWCDDMLWEADRDRSCFMKAPSVCVEVISPSNTTSEIDEKKALYFEKGAEEVWLVSVEGAVGFYLKNEPDIAVAASELFPDFPEVV